MIGERLDAIHNGSAENVTSQKNFVDEPKLHKKKNNGTLPRKTVKRRKQVVKSLNRPKKVSVRGNVYVHKFICNLENLKTF